MLHVRHDTGQLYSNNQFLSIMMLIKILYRLDVMHSERVVSFAANFHELFV
jgi:hypothetical protein